MVALARLRSWALLLVVLPLFACGWRSSSSRSATVADAVASPHVAASLGERSEPPADRPGLGTRWGEEVRAPVSFTPFVRASAEPWTVATLRYNDEEGAAAVAGYLAAVAPSLELPFGGGALRVGLLGQDGGVLPGVPLSHSALVIGEAGERYRILVRNASSARMELVVSVDGLDVIDGKPADPARRGYLIDGHGELVIEGFRTSDEGVAAFRFGEVRDSYAARTDAMSGDQNVGVIGVAAFLERGSSWSREELRRRELADPFPGRGYAAPPR